MTGHDYQQKGGCRCGGIRFTVTTEPLITMACHCTGCQRMTGSAFSLSALYPSHGFNLTKGEPIIGGMRGSTRHFFCPDCMSWMFTRPEGMDDFVNVRATMLDDVSKTSPFIETCTSEMLPWVKTPAIHSFETFPSSEQFAVLISGFIKQRAGDTA